MHEAYLAHHGIKGQKHGQRRWQNKDGSLTPEGRIHYGVGAARKTMGSVAKTVGKTAKKGVVAIRKRVAPTNAELNIQIRKQRSKILNKQKRAELKRLKKTGELEDPKQRKGHKKYSEMTDQEIRDRIDRLKKEAELANLEMSKSYGPGKRMVMDAVTKGIGTGIQTATQSGLKSVGETFIKRAFDMDADFSKKKEEKAKTERRLQSTRDANRTISEVSKSNERFERKEAKRQEKFDRKMRERQIRRTYRTDPPEGYHYVPGVGYVKN